MLIVEVSIDIGGAKHVHGMLKETCALRRRHGYGRVSEYIGTVCTSDMFFHDMYK